MSDSTGRLFCIDPSKKGDTSPELENGNGTVRPNPNSAVMWEYKGSEKTAREQMHLSVSSVAVYADMVFSVDASGFIHCLDFATGKRHWLHDVKEAVYNTPLLVDNKLFVAGQGGDVFVLEAKSTKTLVRSIEGARTIAASPVYANGALYCHLLGGSKPSPLGDGFSVS